MEGTSTKHFIITFYAGVPRTQRCVSESYRGTTYCVAEQNHPCRCRSSRRTCMFKTPHTVRVCFESTPEPQVDGLLGVPVVPIDGTAARQT